jgi:Cdc6-like AAA superfamily ATPase
MSLLYSSNLADYKAQLPVPVQGTCSWILSDPQYVSWIKSEETGLLWVTGEPGSGKTMLSVYLTEHLTFSSNASSHSHVFYFFCDDKITTQRNANDILRSILHQILQQHRRLIKYAKSRWEATGHSLVESFTALWEIFLKIVSESRVGPVSIIVDAIDECEANTRRTLLQSIKRLVNDSRTTESRPRNFVKFFLTSRSSPQDFSVMEESQQNILAIDKNQTRISQDINLVIKSRFGPLAKRVGFSDETRDELESLLFSKAEMSFLWLNIVLQSLESSPLTSKKDFKHIIDNLPRKLEATYIKFLHRIPVESRGLARDILRLLVGSSRHLTLDEMNIAYTINKEEYRTIEKVTEDRQSAIERMLLRVVGPFIRIEGSKVSLIHQSVKDCLAGYTHSTSDEVIRSFGISPSIAALEIASACSRYLLLDDFTMNLFARVQFSDSGEVDQTMIADSDLSLFDSFAALVDGPLLDFEENYAEDYCSRIIQRYKFFEYAAMHWAEHFAQCESIAPKEMQDAVRKLTQRGSHVLKNWMKFFWIKMDIEFALPDDFDTFMASAFFDFPRLLEKCLLEDIHINQDQKDRALFWAARMGCVHWRCCLDMAQIPILVCSICTRL